MVFLRKLCQSRVEMVALIDLNGDRLQGAHVFDARSQGAQLGVQVFVAALDVVDAVDLRFAFGTEGGEDVGAAGADIGDVQARALQRCGAAQDRKSTRLNSSHVKISYAVFCL